MATGATFTIVTNDGKQDNILSATDFLLQRLTRINNMKYQSALLSDPSAQPSDLQCLPTLLDIEKTHVLFPNAHFKPFAAVGFEYSKVNTSTGNLQFGSPLTFQIPQFGDFIHDIALHIIIAQPTLTSTAALAQDAPAMRWCPFPGERLLKKVSQEVNGTVLDEYTAQASTMHREFRVLSNKLLSYERCMGQSSPEEGVLRQPDWVGSGLAASNHAVRAQVHTGLQCATAQKTGSVEMFIPIQFWYCQDVRLAVPSVAIPQGQRNINIDLASQAEIVNLFPRGTGTWASPNGSLGTATISKAELYVNNIFMNPEVHRIYIKRVGFSLIRVHKQHSITCSTAGNNDLMNSLKWPIEFLFVTAKVRDYYVVQTDTLTRQNLDVWDRSSAYTVNQYFEPGFSTPVRQKLLDTSVSATGTVLLSTAGALTGTAVLAGSFSTTFAAIGGTGVSGATGTTGGQGQGGAAVTAVTANTRVMINGVTYAVVSLTSGAAGSALTAAALILSPAPSTAVTANATTADCWLLQDTGLEYQTKSYTPCLNTLQVQAHGVDLYKEFPLAFYNAYTTQQMGGFNINAPKDAGTAFIPFCLYPGTYQPSGHINASRAREFYLVWTSSVFSATVTGFIIVIASAINFLLISDGSAVLRYTT